MYNSSKAVYHLHKCYCKVDEWVSYGKKPSTAKINEVERFLYATGIVLMKYSVEKLTRLSSKVCERRKLKFIVRKSMVMWKIDISKSCYKMKWWNKYTKVSLSGLDTRMDEERIIKRIYRVGVEGVRRRV